MVIDGYSSDSEEEISESEDSSDNDYDIIEIGSSEFYQAVLDFDMCEPIFDEYDY